MRVLGFRVPSSEPPAKRATISPNAVKKDLSEILAKPSDGFRNLPVVYGCVRLISSRLSSLPLRVLDSEGNLAASPTWLTAPNSYLSPRELISGLVWSLLIDGSAFIVPLQDSAGRTESLVLPHPKQVGVRATQAGEITYTLFGLPYEKEILHAKYASIPGEARGISPLDSGKVAIASGEASQDFVLASFSRGATMSYALIAKDSMEEEDKQALAAQLIARHHGANRSYFPLVLDSDMGIEPLSISAEQAQFLELSTWTAATICGSLFGIDPSLLGIVQSGSSLTYSNNLDRERNLWTDVLQPLAVILEETLSKLLPEGFRVDINERPLLYGGPRDRATLARTMAAINASERKEGAEAPYSTEQLQRILDSRD